MSRTKLFIFSVLAGTFITIALTVIGLSIESKTATGILLWQDVILAYLVGPGPLLFVDAQGRPHYEGTPVHALIVPVGFILSILIYSSVSHFILRRFVRSQSPLEKR